MRCGLQPCPAYAVLKSTPKYEVRVFDQASFAGTIVTLDELSPSVILATALKVGLPLGKSNQATSLQSCSCSICQSRRACSTPDWQDAAAWLQLTLVMALQWIEPYLKGHNLQDERLHTGLPFMIKMYPLLHFHEAKDKKMAGVYLNVGHVRHCSIHSSWLSSIHVQSHWLTMTCPPQSITRTL